MAAAPLTCGAAMLVPSRSPQSLPGTAPDALAGRDQIRLQRPSPVGPRLEKKLTP